MTQTTAPAKDIDALLDALTTHEQAALLAGYDFWQTGKVDRLGIPRLKVSDGPNGARGAGGLANGTKAAAFPCAISLGATWDPELGREMGTALARETRDRGARVLLAPTVNIHRSGLNGRNFECYSEDPALTSAMAVAYIEGLQAQGVGATIKHFVANDSEIERQTMSSDVDERTLREIYLPPFEAAVKKAGVWAIMTGYNRVNGTYASDHHWLMTEVARGQWGYDGIFMSDWYGTKSTAEALNAGLDLEMPGETRFRGAALLEAVASGEVTAETLRAATRRMLVLFERVGALDSTGPEDEQENDRPEDRALIRRLGAEGTVLLKNEGLLPLAPGKRVAVIGPNAATAKIMGGGSAQINAHHRISPLDGLSAALGADVVRHAKGCDNNRLVRVVEGEITTSIFTNRQFEGEPAMVRPEEELNFFWFDLPIDGFDNLNFSARVEVDVTPEEDGTHVFGVTSAGGARVYLDGEEIIDGETGWTRGMNFFGAGNDEIRREVELVAGRSYKLRVDYRSPEDANEGITVQAVRVGMQRPLGEAEIEAAAKLAAESDVAILCLGRDGEWDSEGHDLPDMRLPGLQDRLIEAVVAANPDTIVVLQTGGPVEMPWLSSVPAVLQSWYPGQEAGHAIADVLTGAVEPGGRLPQSFPVALRDNSAFTNDDETYPGRDGHVRYAEGLFVGYRHHDRGDVAPLFPFGYGLGYTEFDWGDPDTGRSRMSEDGVTVTQPVTNTGDRAGAEVVQLYVRQKAPKVTRPVKELRAFAKVRLAAGESGEAAMHLTPRDLAWFDVERQEWVAEAGEYELILAANAADPRGTVTIKLDEDWSEPA